MNWKSINLLIVFSLSAALAGGGIQPVSETAWLGREVQVQSTGFCRRYGCVQTNVRNNSENMMGWHDGQQVTYRLGNGTVLDLDVRPSGMLPGQGRWISNARLGLPALKKTSRTFDVQMAVDFYTSLTGRNFSKQAVGYCRFSPVTASDGRRVVSDEINLLLSNWITPAGLPYRARCGQNNAGFWVGYSQQ